MIYSIRDTLTPDRESWARYLVRKLEHNTSVRDSLKVHLRDFKVKSKKCSSDLGPYLTGWLRPTLPKSRIFSRYHAERENERKNQWRLTSLLN